MRILLIVTFIAVWLSQLTSVADAQAGNTATLTGSVLLSQAVPLPSDTRVIVQLQDVSLQDAAATVLAEQDLDASSAGPPYVFSLTYDPNSINPKLNAPAYVVQVFVRHNEDLLMTNTESVPVLTNGAPTENVQIVVEPVS